MAFDFNFNPDELNAQQDENAEKKRTLAMIGGIGDALASGQGFGNFYLGRMNPQSSGVSKTAAALSDTVVDPVERQAKLFAAYKQSQEAKQLQDSEQLLTEKKNPNSQKSMALKALAPRWGIKVTPEMSAYDIEQLINPMKMMETEAASKVDFEKQKKLKEIENQAHLERSREEIAARGAEARETAKEKRRNLSERHVGEIQQYDDTINALQDMIGSSKPEYIGALDARIPEMLVGGDESAFRSRVGRYSDAYRKLITGAGASNQELKRLEGRLPQASDTYENFTAKAKALLDETKRARERHLGTLERSGKDVADFRTGVPETTVTAQDQKAVQWALQNPNDPRAAAILQLHGKAVGVK